MTRTIVDISILQTVPPSNVNRDDTGSPKTALYGGVRRARVSSQAWKRATRVAFNETLDPATLGVRTKRVVELLAARIESGDSSISPERAGELAGQAFRAAGIKLSAPRASTKESPKLDEAGYLVFLSGQQIALMANAAIEVADSEHSEADLKTAGLKKLINSRHSIDIALFGRMVAEAPELNVEAAVQVAHAISVHPVENEFDYFTAVDDYKQEGDDAGAGMIGTVEFNSSTLYRYATVDVDRLSETLGDTHATREAVETFVRAFATSMPTGKQNTFANRTLPDAIFVAIRDSQPVNLVGAFEVAIESDRLAKASGRMLEHARQIDESFATNPVAAWTVSVGESTAALSELGTKVSLDTLTTELGRAVAERLATPK